MADGKYVMALDAGTTSVRAIIYDRNFNVAGLAQKDFTQHFPFPGWVEQDPMEIYASIREVMQEALQRGGLAASDLASIGITNQRETAVVWEKDSGRPVYRAIVWQSRQTTPISEELKKSGLEPIVREKTGLPIDAYFSATKISWILDNVEGARKKAENGQLLFGTIDTWLIWKLTEGKVHATDYSNASRTMLFNIRSLCWDRELLDIMKIPASLLPEARPSSFDFGRTAAGIFGLEIPITGVAGDQQAALFGQRCFGPGDIKNTYGTGCFLLMNTGKNLCPSKKGLVTTIAWGLDGKVSYALEGSVFVAGSVIQWLRDGMGLIRTSSESEWVAREVPDCGGLYCVPAFTGLGAPYWDEQARGLYIGITRGTKRAHFVRAALEAMAYQTKDVIGALEEDSGMKLTYMAVDGGASENSLLIQFQSDILGMRIIRPRNVETTALGAACLSGLASGVWHGQEELMKSREGDAIFEPQMSPEKARELYAGWLKAVSHARNWLA